MGTLALLQFMTDLSFKTAVAFHPIFLFLHILLLIVDRIGWKCFTSDNQQCAQPIIKQKRY